MGHVAAKCPSDMCPLHFRVCVRTVTLLLLHMPLQLHDPTKCPLCVNNMSLRHDPAPRPLLSAGSLKLSFYFNAGVPSLVYLGHKFGV